LLKIDNRAR